MRKALIGILLLVFITPFVMKSYIYVDYHVFFEKIVGELCVNIDKPEMQCNGKCYLNKQIAVVDGVDLERDKAPTPSPKNQDRYDSPTLFFSNFSSFQLNNQTCCNSKLNKRVINHYEFIFWFSVFHPPQFKNI